jgi:hypothetical protein
VLITDLTEEGIVRSFVFLFTSFSIGVFLRLIRKIKQILAVDKKQQEPGRGIGVP